MPRSGAGTQKQRRQQHSQASASTGPRAGRSPATLLRPEKGASRAAQHLICSQTVSTWLPHGERRLGPPVHNGDDSCCWQRNCRQSFNAPRQGRGRTRGVFNAPYKSQEELFLGRLLVHSRGRLAIDVHHAERPPSERPRKASRYNQQRVWYVPGTYDI